MYFIHSVELSNPNLDNISSDFLYHLNINVEDTKNTSDIQKKFGDVRVSGTSRQCCQPFGKQK